MGQRRASKVAAVINPNVVGKALKSPADSNDQGDSAWFTRRARTNEADDVAS